MNSFHLLKSKMLWTGGWVAEDPRRTQIALLVLSALALVAAAVAGVSASGTLFAGMAAGGSGGSG